MVGNNKKMKRQEQANERVEGEYFEMQKSIKLVQKKMENDKDQNDKNRSHREWYEEFVQNF